MSDWEETLDKYGVMIEDELADFIEKETGNAVKYHDFIARLYENLDEYISRRGKRLASCSALLTYKGFDKQLDNRILRVCAGIELYRHCILVHDDFVDEDQERRGGLTIHKKYSQEYDVRLGNGLAVFGGNILYTFALKAFTNSGFEPDKIVKILNLLNDAFQAVNESQVLDLLFEYKMPDVNEWYLMASKRAASLFKASMLVGAVLADASGRDLQQLADAAGHIGYCFDIQDDIIDMFASEEQYGRKPGRDLLKHKKPLHMVYTYTMVDETQLETVKKASEDLNKIRKVVSDCGALEAAKSRSREHAESAKMLISQTNINSEVKAFYTSFIDYVKESLDWYK